MQGVLSVDELQVTPAKNQDTAFREPGRGAVLSVAFVIHELEDVPLQVRVRGPHGPRETTRCFLEWRLAVLKARHPSEHPPP